MSVDGGLGEKLMFLQYILAFCIRDTVHRKLSSHHFSLSVRWVAIKGNPQIHKHIRCLLELVLFIWTGCSSSQRHFEPPFSLLAADLRLTICYSVSGGEIVWGQRVFPAQLTICLALNGLFPLSAGWSGSSGWLEVVYTNCPVQTVVPSCGQNTDVAAESRHWYRVARSRLWCSALTELRSLSKRLDLCMLH